jgi:hypothetical protein
MEALSLAIQDYPPPRMRLLGEVAREAFRRHEVCCLNRHRPDTPGKLISSSGLDEQIAP